MPDNEKQQKKKIEKTNKLNINIKGLNLDKAEYQEIVLSDSNFPGRDYFK